MRSLFAPLLAIAVGLAPSVAAAHPANKVEWAKIEVRPGDDAARLAKQLKEVLAKASKKANFGKAKNIVLSAKVLEFTSEVDGDVVRVTCAIKGRVVGGPTARSKLTFGGSPSDKQALEKQVLTMVANGLVARLAAIARDSGN